MRWMEIVIEAGPEAAEAAGEALQRVGCAGYILRDAETPASVVGYLPADDRLEARLASIKDALETLSVLGITGAGTELTLRPVEEADWANAWKAYYKPMRVGRRLIVTPPWESPELAPSDITIIIDPGMAFGTGSHPTTQLCLVALEDYVKLGFSVADIGTGSGILAIAASKIGASQVVATDNDPLAVSIAQENVAVNDVAVYVADPLPPGSFDVVVANILADVIIGMCENLARLVKPEGLLIASGIIDTRESDVRIAVEGHGFSPLETRQDGEWVALIFRRNSD